MEPRVSFQLFGSDGWVNPPRPMKRISRLFYDAATGQFLTKQDRNFDGGWRWFNAAMFDGMVLYNPLLHPQACVNITKKEINDSGLRARYTAEALLLWKQAQAIVDANYFTARDEVLDAIRAMANRARAELGIHVN